jgi:hypothetical protein
MHADFSFLQVISLGNLLLVSFTENVSLGCEESLLARSRGHGDVRSRTKTTSLVTDWRQDHVTEKRYRKI